MVCIVTFLLGVTGATVASASFVVVDSRFTVPNVSLTSVSALVVVVTPMMVVVMVVMVLMAVVVGMMTATLNQGRWRIFLLFGFGHSSSFSLLCEVFLLLLLPH